MAKEKIVITELGERDAFYDSQRDRFIGAEIIEIIRDNHNHLDPDLRYGAYKVRLKDGREDVFCFAAVKYKEVNTDWDQ